MCKLGSIDEALVAPGRINVAIKRMLVFTRLAALRTSLLSIISKHFY